MITETLNITQYRDIELYIDGGCEPKNPGGVATSGWIFYANNKIPLATGSFVVSKRGKLSTNNFGEYSSLKLALEYLISKNWRGNLHVYADSKLVVNQVNKSWKVNIEHLIKIREKIYVLMNKLEFQFGKNFIISWIPREQNQIANDLCREAYQRYLKNK